MAAFSEGRGRGEWKTSAEKNQARGALEFGKKEEGNIEGKGLVGGWFILAQKLRALGITNQAMRNVDLGTSTSVKEDYRGKGKEKGKGVFSDAVRMETGELGEALWVHVGERDLISREEQLSRCLVGRFGDSVEAVPALSLLKEWAYERNGSHPKEVWVKVVCLPLHLWSREVFKSIGERCGGFIAVDEDTTFFSELQWARILVRAPGKFRQARSAWFNEERREVRDEGGGDSRASGSVRVFQNGKSVLQARGIGEQFECGRGQGEAVGAEGRRPFAVPTEVEGGMESELMAVQVKAAIELTPR
ncbi:hypothetical protein CK203_008051 [Vitis vinifera]|uniref:Uncharacterized protein n=1 Tax=Vitis vinifera TaxID=29760 RepID=A0A438K1T7_VITVI|nr:hypothetical protein CK203_008051 [Vitis vinifera]